MIITYGLKHSKELRPITAERVSVLEGQIREMTTDLKGADCGLSGGLAIPFLLRLYEQQIPVHYELRGVPLDKRVKPSIVVRSWIPDYIREVHNQFYREHSGAVHIICLEQDLPNLVKIAEKSDFGLFHRKRMFTPFPLVHQRIKAEDYVPISAEEVIQLGKESKKEWFTSNVLRLIKKEKVYLFSGEIEDYYDVFVHHMIDPKGQRVIRSQDSGFVRELDSSIVSSDVVRVVSNKDELVVPFALFQMGEYKDGDIDVMLANPFYLFEVKKKHLEKRGDDPRDTVDLEVLNGLLSFLGISESERIRECL